MDEVMIDEALIEALWMKARASERLRQNFDLRTSPEDTSQRMLNALLPGTKVAIHRHEETTETVICLRGRLDVVFFEQTGDEFVETSRVELCPLQGKYGAQIPQGAFHTVEVHEPSCIFEAKDGKYRG